MNREMLPPADRDDFDGPPEQEMAALFAASAPPARPVNVDMLLPRAAARESAAPYAPFFQWRDPMFRRIAAIVSAAAGVLVVVALFMLLSSSARISFAEVIEQVARTRSVTFKATTGAPGRSEEMLRMAALADGLIRMEMPNGNYTVMDVKSGKAICVSPQEKKATIMLGLPVPPGLNPYEWVRNVVNQTSVHLPDEVIDGRKASVFQVEWNEQFRNPGGSPLGSMKVWVDPQTRLPIRIEPVRQNEKGRVAMYDFVFDQPLAPSLFSLDPPAGYAVTTQGLANLPAPPDNPNLLAPQVIPGVGLGPVKFGMSREDAIRILGKPDMDGKINIEYPSRGYGFVISPQRGVAAIACFSQQASAFKVRDFAGKTKEGVGIGSSLEQLEKAFGKPDSQKTNGPETAYIHYNKLGLQLTLFSGKVVTFMMQPTH